MKAIFFLLFLIGASLSAVAATSNNTGLISVYRVTTDTSIHGNPDERGVLIFKLDSGHASGCTWLLIKKDNAYAVSAFLSAHAQNKPIRAFYEISTSSSLCEVYTIQVSS